MGMSASPTPEHLVYIAVDENTQAAVGRVVIHGATLEELIGDLCEAIYLNDDSQDAPEGRLLWKKQAAKRRELAKKLVAASETFVKDAQYILEQHLEEAARLAALRNLIVHGRLMNSDKDNALNVYDSRDDTYHLVTLEELDSIARGLHDTARDIANWVAEVHLRVWYFDEFGRRLWFAPLSPDPFLLGVCERLSGVPVAAVV